jgi:hypothetical protein
MAIKAINNLAKPNKIVLTFLVFGAYPQITEMDTLLLFITKKAKAIYIVTKKVCRF